MASDLRMKGERGHIAARLDHSLSLYRWPAIQAIYPSPVAKAASLVPSGSSATGLPWAVPSHVGSFSAACSPAPTPSSYPITRASEACGDPPPIWPSFRRSWGNTRRFQGEEPEAAMEGPPRLHFVGWRRGGTYSWPSKSFCRGTEVGKCEACRPW